MCTPTSTDPRSIRTCTRILLVSTLAVGKALCGLLLALALAPTRLRPAPSPRPAPIGGIDIQIHLEDERCVSNVRRVLRSTLRRAASTWAPLALPVNRIVVGAGFPADGKADIYDRFMPGDGEGPANRLVVVSLGLRNGDRDLGPYELAGALAAQIQRVIDDVHRDHARVACDGSPPPSPTTRLTPTPCPALTATHVNGSATSLGDMGGTSMPRLQDLLATVQEGQPLVAAGPTSPTTNP